MNWYCIHVMTTKEYKARDALELHYPNRTYLPEIECDKRRLTRSKRTKEPAFPGYIFIQLNQTTDDWSKIKFNQKTSGINGIVTRGDYIPYLEDNFIDAFIAWEDHSTDYEIGEKVIINDKGFINVPAIVKKSGKERIKVMFNFMGQEMNVSVNREQIRPNA